MVDPSVGERSIVPTTELPASLLANNNTVHVLEALNVNLCVPVRGIHAHLVPTKRRRVIGGVESSFSLQGNCRICKKKTTSTCSVCADDITVRSECWLCDTKKGATCFVNHLYDKHKMKVNTNLASRGINAHLVPTKRRRVIGGVESSFSLQGKCRICKKKTTSTCSVCANDSSDKSECWLCDTKKGATCFLTHVTNAHKENVKSPHPELHQQTTTSNHSNEQQENLPIRGIHAHLVPTKRRRVIGGLESKVSLQGRCRICKKKTTATCSVCTDDVTIRSECWLCDTKKGATCFATHVSDKHKVNVDTEKPIRGTHAHLMPTKRRRVIGGVESPFALQGKCRICKKRTTSVCSVCADDETIPSEYWLCDTKKGAMCFSFHVTNKHPEH